MHGYSTSPSRDASKAVGIDSKVKVSAGAQGKGLGNAPTQPQVKPVDAVKGFASGGKGLGTVPCPAVGGLPGKVAPKGFAGGVINGKV